MTGKDDLNMILKAKVVKLKVMLDANGSKLPSQVLAITRKLKNNPVKLKVNLAITQRELAAELSKVRTMVSMAKPVTVRIDVDGAGQKNIKADLNKVTTAINSFNKTYASQAKTMSASKERIRKAMDLGNISTKTTKVGNFNNIKDYARQLKEVERIMRTKVPQGKAGLFSTAQVKDSQGNIRSFVATLKTADGMVEKVHYKWKAKSNTFTPISRKTLDESQAGLLKTEKAIYRLTRAKEQDWAKTKNLTNRNAYDGLIKDATLHRKTLERTNFEYVKMNNKIKDAEVRERQVLTIVQRREKAQQALNMMRGNFAGSDRESQQLIRETEGLIRKASAGRDWIKIQRKMGQLRLNNKFEQDLKRNVDMQHKVKMELQKLVDYGQMTARQFDAAMRQLPLTARRGTADLERQLNVLTRKVRNAKNDIARDMSHMTLLNAGGGSNFKNMVNASDTAGMKAYISSLKGAQVASIKTEDGIDKLGRRIVKLKVQMAGTGKQVQTYTMQMSRLNGQLHQIGGASLDDNSNRNLGVFEQLRIAMARVPVWMTAMTAFYGSIRAVRSAVTQIIEVDKAMTEIRRVASDQINVDSMFEGSVKMSKELGNNIHDILASVGELSRTFGEFNERQLLAITNTATLMSNVSDLDAETATNTLVGTMNAFNIEASESIRIVDALNEVDNDYAISTKQLAEGLQKSASTAKTFGVSMEESIGHITAIGSVTMESGRLIGNSLKTIYSRITTLGAAESILQGVGVAVKEIGVNGEEAVRPVNDILKDLSVRWYELSDSQRQNIAVTVAGRYQLSRFLALMNNYETATKATNTAVFSQGSAMRENAEYLKSFEARINTLKNSWTQLALAIGDAVLSSAMMEIIRLLSTMAGVAVKVTETIGVLPVLMGIIVAIALKMGVFSKSVGLGVAMLSAMKASATGTSIAANTMGTSFARTAAVVSGSSTLMGAKLTATAAKATVATGSFTLMGAQMRAMAASTVTTTTAFGLFSARVTAVAAGMKAKLMAMSVAIRTFTVGAQTALASTGVLAGFVLLGIGIEKLLGWYNKKKETEAEMIKLNKKMVDSYRSHRDGMDGLIDRYEELDGKKMNLNVEEEQEYLNLQKELAEQIPTTVAYIDANGEAHMKSTREIRREIEAVKDLSKAEADLTRAKFLEDMENKSKAYMKIIENVDKLNEKQKMLRENDGKNPLFNGNAGIDNMQWGKPIDNNINIQKNKTEILMAEAEKTSAIQKTIQSIQAQALAYFESTNRMSGLGDQQQAVIEKFISYNESMLRYADTPEKFQKAYSDLFDMGVQVGDVFADAFDIMAQDVGDDPLALGDLRKSLGEVGKAIPDTFYELTNEFGKPIKTLGELEEGLKEIINVSNRVAKGDGNWDGLVDRLKDAGLTSKEAEGYLNGLAREHRNAGLRAEAQARGVEEVTDSIEDLNERAMEAIDLTQALFGTSTAEFEGMKSYLQLMHLIEDTQGEAGKATAEYFDAQVALTDFLGITAEELDKNKDKYYEIAEAMGELKLSEYDTSMSWKEFINSQDISDAQKELLLSWDGTKDIITGRKKEIVDANEDIADSTENIKDIFEKEITNNAVAGAIQDTRKEAEDDNWMKKFRDGVSSLFVAGDDNSYGSGLGSFNAWGENAIKWMNEMPDKINASLEDWDGTFTSWFAHHSNILWDGFNVWGDQMVVWFNSVPDIIRGKLGEWDKEISDWASKNSPEWLKKFDSWSDGILVALQENPKNIRDSLLQMDSEVTDWNKLDTGQLMERFNKWGDDMVKWSQDIPSTLRPKLDEISNSIKVWAEEDSPEMMQRFTKWGDDIVESMQQNPRNIRKALDDITDEIVSWNDMDISTFMKRFNAWGDEMVIWSQGVPDKIGTFLEEIETNIENWSDEHNPQWMKRFNQWGDDMVAWSNDVPTKIRGFLDSFDAEFITWANEPSALMEGFNNWGDDMVEWFNGVPETIRGLIAGWWQPVGQWFTDTSEDMDEGLGKWETSMNQWFEDLPSKFITGLINTGLAIVKWFDDQDQLNREAYGRWTGSIATWLHGLPAELLIGLTSWTTTFTSWGTDEETAWGTRWTGIGKAIGTAMTTQIPELLKGLVEWKTSFDTWFDENQLTFATNITKWGTKAIVAFEEWGVLALTGLSGMKSSMTQWFEDSRLDLAKEITDWGVKAIPSFETWKGLAKTGLDGMWTSITTWFDNTQNDWGMQLNKWSFDIFKWFEELGSNEEVKDAGKNMVDTVAEGVEDNKGAFLDTVVDMFFELPVYLRDAAFVLMLALGREAVERLIDGVNNEENKELFKKAVENIFGIFKLVLTPMPIHAYNLGKKAIDRMTDGSKDGEKGWTSRWGKIAEIAVTAMNLAVGDVAKAAGKMPGAIGTAIAQSAGNVTAGVGAMTKTIGYALQTGLNATFVNPTNAVLKFLKVKNLVPQYKFAYSGGSSKNPTKSSGKGSTMIGYAEGTRKKHMGGEALVGEEGRELAHIPNKGIRVVGQNGAEVIDLPKGSSVLPHPQTEEMIQKYHFPAYATGVGDFFDKFGDNPKKIIEAAIGAAGAMKNPLTGTLGEAITGTGNLVKDSAIKYGVSQIGDFLSAGGSYQGGILGGIGNVPANFGGFRKTSDFGYRIHPIYKTARLHAGVDYAGRHGSPIKAQAGGIVTRSGPSGTGWGTMVKIQNGIYSYIYAHLSRALAKVGTNVKAGNLVGLMGSTGASTGTHLHYEVHKNGKAVRPNVKGFAKGGKINRDQIIRVGEENKAEMIIPLEQHRERAINLWKQTGEQLGQFKHYAKGGMIGKDGSIPSSYTVKSGDTLKVIADSIKTSVHHLMQVNKNIKDANRIQVGQVLNLKELVRAEDGSYVSPSFYGKKTKAEVTNKTKTNGGQASPTGSKATAQKTTSYTIKYGDTLSELAVKFKTTVKNLLSLNKNIKSADKIYKGQKINVSSSSTSAVKTKAKVPAFSIPLSNEQKLSASQFNISLNEAKMKMLSEHSTKYRNMMNQIVGFEKESLSYNQKILKTAESRQKTILGKLSKMPSKKNEKQQEEYDSLRDEYDSNIEKIQSLKVEIENTFATIKERALAVFTNLVDGMVAEWTSRMKKFTDKIDNIDFKIQLAELTEPDNVQKKIELQAQRTVEVKKQQMQLLEIVNHLESKYNKSLKATGANSDATKRWAAELEGVREEYEDIVLEALKAEQEIKNMRKEVAEKGIDQLKNHYSKMKDMSTQAIEAEKAELQKAHDAKMKMYDEESAKINKLYDDKLKSMDKEKSDSEYLESMNDKNTRKAELLNKITLLSRDNSVDGRKRLAEMQKELAELNKEISDTQKERQDSLFREEMEAQKQQQLEAIEAKKEAEEELLGKDLTRLDKDKVEIDRKYDDLINNEKRWADMRDQYTKGSFEVLNKELKLMFDSISNMYAGNFDGIYKGFQYLSQESKDQIKADNYTDINNAQNSSTDLKGETTGAEKAKADTTVKKGRMLTGWYKKKASAENVKKIVTNEYSGKSVKLVQVPEGYKVQADFFSKDRAQQVMTALKERKILSQAKISEFETGGYTGSWMGNHGKMAVLHPEELIMNKKETNDIVDASKLLDKIKALAPNVKINSMKDRLDKLGKVNITNNNVTVNIGSIGGSRNVKQAQEDIAKEVMKHLKKSGKD